MLSNFLLECCSKFLRTEAKGAGLALVDHFALVIDEIQAVWPGRVGFFRGITELVQYRGELDSQFSHAGSGNPSPLFFIFWAGKDDVVLKIACHLPDIAGMGLSDVNSQERNFTLVLLIELVESGNLPPEGRSSIASEDENHGLLPVQRGKLDHLALIDSGQEEIRSCIADSKVTRAGVGPQRFEWK